MAPISLYGIVSFFSEEPRLIKRGENAVKSGHVVGVEHYWDLGTIKAEVQASMKDKSYDVLASCLFSLPTQLRSPGKPR